MTGDLLIGRVIDEKYRIEAEIGAGGMATVYRATRLRIGDAVAIKILHPELLREPKFAERFEREAQAAARLKHPNVAAIYDFGEDGELLYLVMELVEGENLRTVIKEHGPMPAAAAAEIVRQVCAALTEAHRHQIVHRDIKPANIAVDQRPDGVHVKVLDFGIASLRGGTMMTFTQTGAVMGTPAYMSPEQCLGEELDGRSDIYSLGVVLFEMLCGVVPFNSPTATAVVMQHVQQTPPPLRVLNVSISPGVEAVVLHALAKRREDRYQTARELADALTAAVGGTSAAVPVAHDLGPMTQQLPALHAPFALSEHGSVPVGGAAVKSGGGGPTAGIAIGLIAAAVLVAAGFGAQRLLGGSSTGHATASTTAAAKSAAPKRLPAAVAAVPAREVALAPAQPQQQQQRPPDPIYQNSIPFVNEYYRLWNAGDFGTMYGMLSARMQRKNPYDQYVKYHSLVQHIDAAATPGYAANVVNVRILSRDREKDGSITESVNEGQWFLTTEDGRLKLDAQQAHEVRPATVVAAAPATPYVEPATPYVAPAAPAAPYLSADTSVSFVQRYYQLWNARQYDTMYGMLSSDMQRRHPYEPYVKYHAFVVRIDASVSATESPYVVNVRIVSWDREKDGSISQSLNEGQWFLAIENGTLKLADQKVHDVK